MYFRLVRCPPLRGAPFSKGAAQKTISSSIPRLFRQSVSLLPCTIVQPPTASRSPPNFGGPNASAKFSRPGTFPINTHCRLSGNTTPTIPIIPGIPEIPDSKAFLSQNFPSHPAIVAIGNPPPVHIPHIYSLPHQRQHLPDSPDYSRDSRQFPIQKSGQ